MKVRQHWMAMVSPSSIVMILLSAASLFAFLQPKLIVKSFGITRHMPGFEYVAFFYGHGWLFVLGPLAWAAFSVFMAFSWWQISYFLIENGQLEYQMGPFISDQVPLRAIQSKNVRRGIIGVLCGFGTVVIDAGRKEETLKFVPDIENFMNELNRQYA